MEKKHSESGDSPILGTNGRGSKGSTRIPRSKETQITKAEGFEDLNDREKELCIMLTVAPQQYLDLKKKLTAKAAKHKLTRSVVVDLAGKEMTKDKAFVIYDFLAHYGVINSSTNK